MGMKPVCWLSGLLIVGLALPGCESCNSWGNKGHTGMPPGYASGGPPASTGQQAWNNRGSVQPAGGTAYGQRPPTTSQVPPASPVQRTSTVGTPSDPNAIPPLPTSAQPFRLPNKGVSEKPVSYPEIELRNTAPPSAGEPPATEPLSPPALPDQPRSSPPQAFEDRGGPSLTPPNQSLPPVPQPSRPAFPN